VHIRSKSSRHTTVVSKSEEQAMMAQAARGDAICRELDRKAGRVFRTNSRPTTNFRMTDSLKRAAKGLNSALTAFIDVADGSAGPRSSNDLIDNDECDCEGECTCTPRTQRLHVNNARRVYNGGKYMDMAQTFMQHVQDAANTPVEKRHDTAVGPRRQRIALKAAARDAARYKRVSGDYSDMVPIGVMGFMAQQGGKS